MSWLGTFYCWLAVGICFDHDEYMASGEKSRFAVSAGRVGPGIILPRRLCMTEDPYATVRLTHKTPPTPTLSCGLMDRRKHRAVVSGWSGDCTDHLNQDTRKH
jgi:hypothetical protein